MGTICRISLKMLRLASTLLLGAVAIYAAPPSASKGSSCAPSSTLLSRYSWVYAANSDKSNTKDVWFTAIIQLDTFQTCVNACSAMDKNVQIASIMSKDEAKVIQGIHGTGDKTTAKTWTGGYYGSDGQYRWMYGGKNTDEVMTYQSWNSEEGYPSYDPDYRSRTDLRYTKNNWKDSDPSREHPCLCMMRCGTNYWQ